MDPKPALWKALTALLAVATTAGAFGIAYWLSGSPHVPEAVKAAAWGFAVTVAGSNASSWTALKGGTHAAGIVGERLAVVPPSPEQKDDANAPRPPGGSPHDIRESRPFD